MPPITNINILGWLKFSSHMLKLPTTDSYEPPQGQEAQQQFSDSMQENQAAPAVPTFFMPLPWLQPQNPNKYHCDSCDDIGKKFHKFHDDMLDAVKFAVDMWRLQAKFKDLKVFAMSAVGTPGCLDGPELESLIKNAPSAAPMTGNEGKWRDAVAKGVSGQFKKWQDKVMVPGLPWYPAFIAFPAPEAPPMPNIPMPLITCVSPMMPEIVVPMKLKDAMVDALDQGIKDDDPDKQHEALFDAIGTVLALAFIIWLASQQVMLVLGKGPIPLFKPPYIPVGPVIAGDNISTPGHLMT